MTVESGSRARSASGAFKRSLGGAFTRLSGKYYYHDEYYYTNVGAMSDFSGWSNTAFTSSPFANGDSTSMGLYDADTGVYIGAITQELTCTPQVRIYNYYNIEVLPLHISTHTACPTLVAPESAVATTGSTMLATRHDYCFNYPHPDAPPELIEGYGYGNRIKCYLKTANSLAGGGAADTYASISTIGTIFYSHPTTSIPLVRVGNDFYKAGLQMTVDVDVDTWANGKFDDVYVGYHNPGYGYPGYGHLFRTNLDFTSFRYVEQLRPDYDPFLTDIYKVQYYDCYNENSLVEIYPAI